MASAPGYDNAVFLYLHGQYYTCLEACERVLKETPNDPETLHLVGLLCYKAGDIKAAASWFEKCLHFDPDHAEAHIDLALTHKRQGRLAEAIASYRRGLELDPRNAQAQYNFGLALRTVGRHEEAAAAFRKAVAIDPLINNGFNALGLAEADAGNNAAAMEAFRKAIAATPQATSPYRNLAMVARRTGHPMIAVEALRWGIGIHGNREMGRDLAAALEEAGQADEALALLRRMTEEDPDNADNWAALGDLEFRRHEFSESLDALRRCAALAPERAEIHMRIHTMAQIVGQRELALAHQLSALAITRLFSERGGPPGRPHLLILKAAGDWQANLPTDFIIRPGDWGAVHHYFVDPAAPPSLSDLPACDAVFNAVAEPDLTRSELAAAGRIVAALGQPTLNHPAAVAATGRADIAAKLADLPGCLVPTSLRLAADGASAALGAALADGRLRLPLLLRPVGTHAGQGIALVPTKDELELALNSLSETDLYATNFVDYRNADGHYRKYRVIVVDGTPYPFHMAVSKRWLVHYYNAVIDDPRVMDREEERFLADIASVFPRPLQAAFTEMQRRLGLDFFGVDCGLTADGRILLFEVDVGVIVHVMDDPKRHPYKHRYVPRIFDAMREMIDARIAKARALAASA